MNMPFERREMKQETNDKIVTLSFTAMIQACRGSGYRTAQFVNTLTENMTAVATDVKQFLNFGAVQVNKVELDSGWN